MAIGRDDKENPNLVCPPFFKIEKDSHVFYLLGTHHKLPLSILPDAFISLIKTAKILVTETILSEKLTEENLREIGLLNVKESDWLEKLSVKSKDEFIKKAKVFFKTRTNIDESSYDKILNFINPSLAHWIVRLTKRPEKYMDSELQEMFEKVLSLEGLERYEILKKFTMELSEFDSFLQKESKEELEESKSHYSQGQVKALLFNKSNLYASRNLSWLKKIEEYKNIKEQPILVAVGSGHIFDKNGLLDLLHQRGYKIQQIDKNGNLIDHSIISSLRA